ncbi:MAG: NAD(P)H-dependent oxidoreductase [Lysobacterales bacterium]|nr:NAD(P)H-dependent oxidoreductase [Xanthomonadales bacterium]MCB1613111.1 NAD(P)H-dependent oxidoreductase [Xanthomonadales bacterium]MCP5477036.1 NAD(P)H-dependent oxidoreductase [Rhodanobacteraceae bacterium]
MRPRLLIVHHSHGWRTRKMAEVMAAAAEATDAVDVVSLGASDANIEDVLAADGYLIGSPETFGSMSGLIKDFFERIYYPAQDRVTGRPYALFVCAGNDGSGAIASMQRVARGLGWKEVQAPVLAHSDEVELRLRDCEQLGAGMALGLSMGIF